MKRWSLSVALFALFLTEGTGLAQGFKGNPENGRAIYQSYCLRCHGQNLDGKGPEAASLKVPAADFHAPYSRAKDETELRFTIKRGRDLTAMHGWEDQLREVHIIDVSAYIRSVIPHEGP